MTNRTKTVDIDGKSYQFELLPVFQAAKIEVMVGSLLFQIKNGAVEDFEILEKLSKIVFKNMCCDDFEVKDIEEHFFGEIEHFNVVLIQAVIANFPKLKAKLEQMGVKLNSDLLTKGLQA